MTLDPPRGGRHPREPRVFRGRNRAAFGAAVGCGAEVIPTSDAEARACAAPTSKSAKEPEQRREREEHRRVRERDDDHGIGNAAGRAPGPAAGAVPLHMALGMANAKHAPRAACIFGQSHQHPSRTQAIEHFVGKVLAGLDADDHELPVDHPHAYLAVNVAACPEQESGDAQEQRQHGRGIQDDSRESAHQAVILPASWFNFLDPTRDSR